MGHARGSRGSQGKGGLGEMSEDREARGSRAGAAPEVGTVTMAELIGAERKFWHWGAAYAVTGLCGSPCGDNVVGGAAEANSRWRECPDCARIRRARWGK